MMPPLDLFSLRKKWFNLQAKMYIERYFMGIVIVFIFLPGVAIGDNLNTLLAAISKPFAVLSQLDSTFVSRQISLFLLGTIFVVWTRAQILAINGGSFVLFQQSLPISQAYKRLINIKMLLIGNHFLWPFVIASYFYLSVDENLQWLAVARNTFLMALLLLLQYISIFVFNARNLIWALLLALVFIVPLNPPLEVLRMIAVGLVLVFVLFQLHKEHNHMITRTITNSLYPKVLSTNFYLQILFKSGLTSSLLRMEIIMCLFIGFVFAVDNWVEDYRELAPYYLALESSVAYFVSGFFVAFLDQRNTMQTWLITLPVKRHFWLLRDVVAAILLTVLLHIPFYLWAVKLSSISLLSSVFSYHILMLVLCYPIRVFVTEKQTLITFVVLFIITAITLFNLS